MTAILFDFNGTMIFDTPIVEQSWQSFLHNHHINQTIDEIRPWIHGLDPLDTIEHFFGTTSKDECQQLVDEKEELYRNLCLQHQKDCYKLVAGLEEFLSQCQSKNIKMTIATAAPLKNVEFFFSSLNLNRWFNFSDVIFCDGSFPGKPDPTIYLMAAKKLDTPISDCIIFEDAVSGLKAAVSSKCKCVIGLTSLLNENQLKALRVDYAINDYKDTKFLFSLLN